MKENRNYLILLCNQVMTSATISLVTSVASLAGAYLSPLYSLSTIPITFNTMGSLIMTYPASFIMGNMGRKKGFLLQAMLGILASSICIISLAIRNLIVFTIGSFFIGCFNSFNYYYKFAAIDAIASKNKKIKSISLLSGIAILGSILGPSIGSSTAYLFQYFPYMGSYCMLLLFFITMLITRFFMGEEEYLIKNQEEPTFENNVVNGLKQVDFIRVLLLGTLASAIMVFVMNATPLSIASNGYDIHVSSSVLQVHFSMMYLPAFLIPTISKRIRCRALLNFGIFLLFFESLLALLNNQSIALLTLELGMLGFSWCLLSNLSSIMITDTYSDNNNDKSKKEGVFALSISIANMLASLSSGFVFSVWGWLGINLSFIPFVVILFLVNNTEFKKNIIVM